MWPNRQETEDLVKFTEEILNEKLHFLCSVNTKILINPTRHISLNYILNTTSLFFNVGWTL